MSSSFKSCDAPSCRGQRVAAPSLWCMHVRKRGPTRHPLSLGLQGGHAQSHTSGPRPMPRCHQVTAEPEQAPVTDVPPRSGAKRPADGDGPRAPAAKCAQVSESKDDAQRRAIRGVHGFNIVRKIDDGAYGEVFEAKDGAGDKVAIKRIGMATQHTMPQDVVREIASLSKLRSHPLVVDLKAVFVHSDDIHLVRVFLTVCVCVCVCGLQYTTNL